MTRKYLALPRGIPGKPWFTSLTTKVATGTGEAPESKGSVKTGGLSRVAKAPAGSRKSPGRGKSVLGGPVFLSTKNPPTGSDEAAIGVGPRDVAQPRGLELAPVRRILGGGFTADVGLGRLHPDAQVVEALIDLLSAKPDAFGSLVWPDRKQQDLGRKT